MTSVEGLAALSLDALSSVAYGPETMVLTLVAGGVAAVKLTLPITIVITAMLVVLVVSYSQVIAAHPDGGGAYAVAKTELGPRTSLLAAASLVVDYVLTVAVSLAAGAASLASVFPSLAHHLLVVCLVGLAVLTAVNMEGITESARLLMLPTVVFVISIIAVIIMGFAHWRSGSTIGTSQPLPRATEAVGLLLVLKAFAGGCSAVTGVEAIANGVPAFREPRVQRAQRTEISLGVLLGVMLIGLAVLIRLHHVLPRGGVTILAQLTARSLGKGWAFYVSNLAVTLVLALAANTSFGGLPVLMSLLARDHRLPHMFYLRAERPVFRYGVVALAVLSAALLVAVNASTNRLIPLFTIGVFVGFTISQVGLVRHWLVTRPPGWRGRVALNGTGATMTSVAIVVFVASKFVAGAWVVLITIPALMALFASIEKYYRQVATELDLGHIPERPERASSIVVVPVSTSINRLTEKALCAALSLGERVVALAVAADEEERNLVARQWQQWNPGVDLEIVLSPQHALVRSVVRYVNALTAQGVQVSVLISEIQPRKRRHELLHNQRGLLLAAALRSRTDAVIATLPFRLHD
jgi:amino acid transporter